MKKNRDELVVAFAGGGTGGHIYPGLAVCDALRELCEKNNRKLKIYWIGNSKGMDRTIVEKNVDGKGRRSADVFVGIPSGKLRRYISFQNFLDLFKIFAGLVKSWFVLCKIKPDFLFSKGGFVSVPPCMSAKALKIPVFTHECDFTPGLATRLNSKSAEKILVSYEETKDYLGTVARNKAVLTGNPVRPVFYSADANKGLEFLGLQKKDKPVLLVIGGSLGARQINELISEKLEWLTENFYVVHQTGNKNTDQSSGNENNPFYKPYPFIYSQMPDVIAASDVVISRAGANSIWECSVLGKPMVLIPLCGSGTRGDQEDNAAFFEKQGASFVLSRENAAGDKLIQTLKELLDENKREDMAKKSKALSEGKKPCDAIAELIYEYCTN